MMMRRRGGAYVSAESRATATNAYWMNRIEQDAKRQCLKCLRPRLRLDMYGVAERLVFEKTRRCVFCQRALPAEELKQFIEAHSAWLSHCDVYRFGKEPTQEDIYLADYRRKSQAAAAAVAAAAAADLMQQGGSDDDDDASDQKSDDDGIVMSEPDDDEGDENSEDDEMELFDDETGESLGMCKVKGLDGSAGLTS